MRLTRSHRETDDRHRRRARARGATRRCGADSVIAGSVPVGAQRHTISRESACFTGGPPLAIVLACFIRHRCRCHRGLSCCSPEPGSSLELAVAPRAPTRHRAPAACSR